MDDDGDIYDHRTPVEILQDREDTLKAERIRLEKRFPVLILELERVQKLKLEAMELAAAAARQ
jgi:hypothetical protein